MKKQPWISHPLTDIFFILMPAFFSLLLVFMLPDIFQNDAALTDAGWLVLVVLIDVSHVYSTLYRTYFDPVAFQKRKSLLLVVPAAGLMLGILLYSIHALLFWRVLTYLAVFHFIRQQYGFMRIYSRAEDVPVFCKKIDVLAVYTATIYPIIYWHLSGPRNFNWFLEGDFFYIKAPPFMLYVLKGVYLLIILLYLIKEIWLIIRTKQFNIPRNVILAGTFLSWYVGIVYYNGDLAFTMLNVVSHGIPYMALVWIHGNKTRKKTEIKNGLLRFIYHPYGIGLFLLIIFLFAFLEESLWDILVWKEHSMVLLSGLFPVIQLPGDILSLMVPILALPQVTHYILDAFIWRIRKDDFHWSNGVSKHTR